MCLSTAPFWEKSLRFTLDPVSYSISAFQSVEIWASSHVFLLLTVPLHGGLSSEITSRTHLLSFRLHLVMDLATVMRKAINVCFGSSSLTFGLQLLYQENVEKNTNRDVMKMKAKNIKSWQSAIHPSCSFLSHLESHTQIHMVNLFFPLLSQRQWTWTWA